MTKKEHTFKGIEYDCLQPNCPFCLMEHCIALEKEEEENGTYTKEDAMQDGQWYLFQGYYAWKYGGC